jgi:pseudaminic acid biosynthesis-associated methylase
MTSTNRVSEAERLERLWSADFGNEYVDRNVNAYDSRGAFWLPLVEELRPASVLEIGCGVGGNLQWIAQGMRPDRVIGVDVNAKALKLLEERVPGVRAVHAPARDVPFADRSIDLVFTMGVLIHQPEESLMRVMSEMVRLSQRWVFCAEYYDTETVEIPYRGVDGALFRRDYKSLFESFFPTELRLVREGLRGENDGDEGYTWWLFERV